MINIIEKICARVKVCVFFAELTVMTCTKSSLQKFFFSKKLKNLKDPICLYVQKLRLLKVTIKRSLDNMLMNDDEVNDDFKEIERFTKMAY